MDKNRLFLAFLLSFLFLTLWSSFFAPPAIKKTTTSAPVAVLARGTDSLSAADPSDSLISDEKKPDFLEKKEILENEKLKVEFSNIGGTISEITIKAYQEAMPVRGIVDVVGYSDKEFTVEKITPDEIVYVCKDPKSMIRKKYSLSGDYLLTATVNADKNVNVKIYTLDISRLDKNKLNQRDLALYEYSIKTSTGTIRKGNAVKFTQKDNVSENIPAKWFGFRDRYFALVVKPEYDVSGFKSIVSSDNMISFISVPRETTGNVILDIYCGPQVIDDLKKYNKGFEEIMVFSKYGLLDFIAKCIYKIFLIINKIIPSWGLSIIILGILIYLSTYPLTLAGLSSMRKMQALQPQMARLKEQYKNNPQKLNQEIMELYKENKVNPFGGCLPMLIQMPIFIGLYQVLWRSIALKGQPFLWIKDLSFPDRAYILNQNYPIIGNEINLLPVLMGIVMFFQQKISMKNIGTADPDQQAQQKMMQWFLPGMMFFFFYKASSGLNLYFTVLYLMTTLTQWKIYKTQK